MSRHAVANGLRLLGVDVVTVLEAGNRGQPEEWQLDFAMREQRVLYTANQRDFARIHAERVASRTHHAGIVVLTRQLTPPGAQVHALKELHDRLDHLQMDTRLEYLFVRLT